MERQSAAAEEVGWGRVDKQTRAQFFLGGATSDSRLTRCGRNLMSNKEKRRRLEGRRGESPQRITSMCFCCCCWWWRWWRLTVHSPLRRVCTSREVKTSAEWAASGAGHWFSAAGYRGILMGPVSEWSCIKSHWTSAWAARSLTHSLAFWKVCTRKENITSTCEWGFSLK